LYIYLLGSMAISITTFSKKKLSIMAFIITIFSITIFSITIFSIMTFSITIFNITIFSMISGILMTSNINLIMKGLFETLSIRDTQR
jgi:hypothetical protein